MRRRIRISENDDGTPVYQWISADSADALNDATVQAYIQSGRISEFLTASTATVPEAQTCQVTFHDYTERWLTLYKSGLKGTSRNDYHYILSHYLYPAFGDRLLSEITTDNIQELFNAHAALARSTIHKMEMYLEQILRSAVKDKLIRENPVDHERLNNPSRVQYKREALSKEEYMDILGNIHTLEPRDRKMLALLAFTGMRRGEALGLRWEDIDFESKQIHIQRNVVFITNSPTIDTTKSVSGNRTIPMDDRLVALLRPIEPEGFVVGGASPISKSSYNKAMQRIGRTID